MNQGNRNRYNKNKEGARLAGSSSNPTQLALPPGRDNPTQQIPGLDQRLFNQEMRKTLGQNNVGPSEQEKAQVHAAFQAKQAAHGAAAAIFEQSPAAATAGNPQVVQSEIDLDAALGSMFDDQPGPIPSVASQAPASPGLPSNKVDEMNWKGHLATGGVGAALSLLGGGGLWGSLGGAATASLGAQAGELLAKKALGNQQVNKFASGLAETINQNRLNRINQLPDATMENMRWTTPEEQARNIGIGTGAIAGLVGGNLVHRGIKAVFGPNEEAQAQQVAAQDPTMMKAAYTQALFQQQAQQQMAAPPALNPMERAQIGANFAYQQNSERQDQEKAVSRKLYMMAMERGDAEAMDAIAEGRFPAEAAMYGLGANY